MGDGREEEEIEPRWRDVRREGEMEEREVALIPFNLSMPHLCIDKLNR